MDKEVLEQVNNRVPFVCERNLLLHDHECRGRITREHAVYYAGRKIDEAWAIVLLCSWAHAIDEFIDRGGLDKQKNEWIVINRMTKREEKRFPRVDWAHKREYLNGMYGVPKLPTRRARR